MKRSWMIVVMGLAAGVCGCGGNAVTPALDARDTVLVNVGGGRSRLQVYGSSGSASIVRPGAIYTDCLCVRILDPKQEVAFETQFSEADPGWIIDFSESSHNVYRLTECTWDDRDGCLTNGYGNKYSGLIETTYAFAGDGKLVVSEQVVLKGENADAAAAGRLVGEGTKAILDIEALQKQRKSDGSRDGEEEAENRLEQVSMHLRNIGVNDPDMALAAMEKLNALAKAKKIEIGCCCSNGIVCPTGEVERMKEVYAANGKAAPRGRSGAATTTTKVTATAPSLPLRAP